jgi:hypothetical protein
VAANLQCANNPLSSSDDPTFPHFYGNASFQVPIPTGVQPGEYTFVASIPTLVGVSRVSLQNPAYATCIDALTPGFGINCIPSLQSEHHHRLVA